MSNARHFIRGKLETRRGDAMMGRGLEPGYALRIIGAILLGAFALTMLLRWVLL